jgi:hypothetical protein
MAQVQDTVTAAVHRCSTHPPASPVRALNEGFQMTTSEPATWTDDQRQGTGHNGSRCQQHPCCLAWPV